MNLLLRVVEGWSVHAEVKFRLKIQKKTSVEIFSLEAVMLYYVIIEFNLLRQDQAILVLHSETSQENESKDVYIYLRKVCQTIQIYIFNFTTFCLLFFKCAMTSFVFDVSQYFRL